MSRTNTSKGLTKQLDGDSALFDLRFWRSYRLLHFIAFRILDDPEQAKKAVEAAGIQLLPALRVLNIESAFRSWQVKVLIDDALLLRRKQRTFESSQRNFMSVAESNA
jgi:hypothetical protein